MTELELLNLKKLYYSIGEVASFFNVNTSLIRFWEKEFNFEASKKTIKGNRLYAVKDIEKFNKIYHLVKVQGFTLDGAKKTLKENQTLHSELNLPLDKIALITKLEGIRDRLLEISGG